MLTPHGDGHQALRQAINGDQHRWCDALVGHDAQLAVPRLDVRGESHVEGGLVLGSARLELLACGKGQEQTRRGPEVIAVHDKGGGATDLQPAQSKVADARLG